jgi:hypothetical protein
MSHLAVIVWTVCMAIIATGISQTTIGVNYLVTCMGVFTGCAVFPIYSTVLWKRQNKIAVVVAPVIGSITAIASWLGSAYALEGVVTITSTSQTIPLVIGNATSLFSGAIYSIICTYVFGPDNFDWDKLLTDIIVVDDSDIKGLTSEQLAEQTLAERLSPEADRALKRGKIMAILTAAILCFIFVILWVGHLFLIYNISASTNNPCQPMPMYGTDYVFSKPFFRFWVALTFLWAFGAAVTITLMPLIEGRKTIVMFWHFITRQRDVIPRTEGIASSGFDGATRDQEESESGDRKQHLKVDEEKL